MEIMLCNLMKSSLCSVTAMLTDEIEVRPVHQDLVINKECKQSSDGITTKLDLKSDTGN